MPSNKTEEGWQDVDLAKAAITQRLLGTGLLLGGGEWPLLYHLPFSFLLNLSA